MKKWLPRTQEKPVPASTLSYHPPHTKGDGDFDTHDDEPMNVRVKAEVTWDASSLRGRVFMSAREPRPDYTTAEGTTEWRTLFTAPAHWKITSVTPTSAAELNVNINDHGVKQYGLGAGEVAQSFEVAGDRDGDEAGSWTGVNVFWREFRVQLEESEPDWLNPSYTAEATDL